MPPNSRIVSAIIRAGSSGSVMSAAHHLRATSSANARRFSSRLPTAMTFAPPAANDFAADRPIPAEAPMTNTEHPCISDSINPPDCSIEMLVADYIALTNAARTTA